MTIVNSRICLLIFNNDDDDDDDKRGILYRTFLLPLHIKKLKMEKNMLKYSTSGQEAQNRPMKAAFRGNSRQNSKFELADVMVVLILQTSRCLRDHLPAIGKHRLGK